MELTKVQEWLWFGFVGLSAGSLVILYLLNKLPAKLRFHGLMALLITSLATISYYALARGQADVMVAGHVVYFGRYLDWLFTTPLLLLSLLVIALPSLKSTENSRQRASLIATVLVSDVLMIVTGLFADLSTNNVDRSVWYVASCLWFLVVLWKMYGEVKAIANSQNHHVAKAYNQLLSFLTVAWFCYPIVWLLGTSGYSLITLAQETAFYAVLDVSAKAVFGILVVLSITKLHQADSHVVK